MVTLLALEAALFWVLLVLAELELLPELPELPEPLDEPVVPVAEAPLVTLVMVDVPPTALVAKLEAASVADDDDSTVEVLCDCETASRPWLIVLTVLHWLLEGAGWAEGVTGSPCLNVELP